MTVPEIQSVETLFGELVEVFGPGRLVVKEGKLLRGVTVIVLRIIVCELWLLHADGCAAEFELGMVFVVELYWKCMSLRDAACKFERAVQNAGGIVARDNDGVAETPQKERFFRVGPEVRDLSIVGLNEWIVASGEEDPLVARKVSDSLLEAQCCEPLAGGRTSGELDAGSGKGWNREGESEECEADSHGDCLLMSFGWKELKQCVCQRLHPGSLSGTSGWLGDLGLLVASEVFWKRIA